MKMTFIGAAHEVTGSCTYLEIGEKRLLVDFGMEQGWDTYENVQIPCAPGQIDYVLLTHAHIDHSGLLPLLYAGGFRGEIHATEATVNLCEIMLRDSAHIQEFEAEWRNRKAMRRGDDPYVPLYTMEEALGALELFVPHRYDVQFALCEGVSVRFCDAGHLLGSAHIELWLTEGETTRKIVFSGDVGNTNQPLIRDPMPPESADMVVIESTYGGRFHEKPKGYLPALVEVIRTTFARGGSVIIPSFAVGRTQELLYYLKQIKDAGLLDAYGDFPVYVDSPLAIESTQIFLRNKNACFDQEALSYVERGENPIGVTNLITTVTSEDSRLINFDKRQKILISASGMCEAGRIKHHLKHNLWKPENTVLFVGYQAEGTLGRRLLEGAQSVTLFGETVKVAANIVQLPGMSGHADEAGLLNWLGAIDGVQRVFVNHGADAAVEMLKDALTNKGYNVYAPYSGAVVDLADGSVLYDAKPVPVAHKPKRNAASFDRLNLNLDRLTAIINGSRGLSNKELAKMADQLGELCNRWASGKK